MTLICWAMLIDASKKVAGSEFIDFLEEMPCGLEAFFPLFTCT